jgi:hypothetical protein
MDLNLTLQRSADGTRWRRFASGCRQLLIGIAEGVAAARRYERLAAMHDRALARRGLRRSDIARFALLGEVRPNKDPLPEARPVQGDTASRRRIDDRLRTVEHA